MWASSQCSSPARTTHTVDVSKKAMKAQELHHIRGPESGTVCPMQQTASSATKKTDSAHSAALSLYMSQLEKKSKKKKSPGSVKRPSRKEKRVTSVQRKELVCGTFFDGKKKKISQGGSEESFSRACENGMRFE